MHTLTAPAGDGRRQLHGRRRCLATSRGLYTSGKQHPVPPTPGMTPGPFTSFRSCSDVEVVGHKFRVAACCLPGFRSGDDLNQSLFSK